MKLTFWFNECFWIDNPIIWWFLDIYASRWGPSVGETIRWLLSDTFSLLFSPAIWALRRKCTRFYGGLGLKRQDGCWTMAQTLLFWPLATVRQPPPIIISCITLSRHDVCLVLSDSPNDVSIGTLSRGVVDTFFILPGRHNKLQYILILRHWHQWITKIILK